MNIEVEIRRLTTVDSICFPDDSLAFYVPRDYATPDIIAMYMELVVENRNRWLW